MENLKGKPARETNYEEICGNKMFLKYDIRVWNGLNWHRIW